VHGCSISVRASPWTNASEGNPAKALLERASISSFHSDSLVQLNKGLMPARDSHNLNVTVPLFLIAPRISRGSNVTAIVLVP
jgi:hypothetical protein